MIRGLFVGVGIMLVCPLIPVAHFVLVPASPFIAGYFGINYVREETRSPSALALQYGALLALVLLALTGVPAAVFTVWFDPPSKFLALIWIGVAIFTLYTGSMACLGAMFSRMRRNQQAALETTQPASDRD